MDYDYDLDLNLYPNHDETVKFFFIKPMPSIQNGKKELVYIM